MNYKIVADSSSNVFELSGADYAHVPLKILNQGVEYVDVPGLDVFGMLEDLKASREGSSTSCPNAFEWEEAFGDADGVFHACQLAAAHAVAQYIDILVLDPAFLEPALRLFRIKAFVFSEDLNVHIRLP